MRLESTYDDSLAYQFSIIFSLALCDLFSPLGIPLSGNGSQVKSLGIQFSSIFTRRSSESPLFAVDDLCDSRPDDAYNRLPDDGSAYLLHISDLFEKIHLMAESRRVFDPEDFKFTCIRNEDSLVIRVCQFKFPVFTAC
jgi:hypothetical protein